MIDFCYSSTCAILCRMKQENDGKWFVDKSCGVGVGGLLSHGNLTEHENHQ